MVERLSLIQTACGRASANTTSDLRGPSKRTRLTRGVCYTIHVWHPLIHSTHTHTHTCSPTHASFKLFHPQWWWWWWWWKKNQSEWVSVTSFRLTRTQRHRHNSSTPPFYKMSRPSFVLFMDLFLCCISPFNSGQGEVVCRL